MTDPRRTGPAPALCRGALGFAAAGYAVAVRVRNACYDHGWLPAARAAAPVISVGNITAGGTGKTPLVAWLAQLLQTRGRRPAVLSRGYGRNPRSGLDDENQMLAALAPGVPIVVDPDRVRGAARAVAQHAADALILDDGFQHRRLARDLDIVLVDALAPFGERLAPGRAPAGHLLPRGLLREPLKGLARADLIVLTRTDLADAGALEQIRKALAVLAPRAPIVLSVHRAVGLRGVAGRAGGPTLEELPQGRWSAFCGIGNPEGFLLTLERLGAEPVQFRAFPDHHRYEGQDVRRLLRGAQQAGCRGVLTTEKDAIKVAPLLGAAPPVPVLALRVRIEVTEGRGVLERHILSAVKAGAPTSAARNES